jgi:hypothetical protein
VLRGLSRRQVIDEHRQELKQRVDAIIEDLKADRTPQIFYIAEPKDEKRSLEKVAKGDTRFILVAPLEWLIVNVMYFGFFLDIQARHHADTDLAIGINPYGLDWDRMARDLNEFPVASDADAKSWDITFPTPVALEYPNQAAMRYPGTPTRILTLICVATFHCVILHHAHFFDADMMPSGDFKTAKVNSAVNSVVSRAVFNMYPQSYRLKTLGDDKVSSHEEGFPVEEANRQLMDLFHFHMTDAEKGGLPRAKKLSECSFLKRSFVYSEGRFIAPLALQSIKDMLTWVRADTVREAVQQSLVNWEVAQRELSLHPPQLYNLFNHFFSSLVLEAKPNYVSVPHADMRSAVLRMALYY